MDRQWAKPRAKRPPTSGDDAPPAPFHDFWVHIERGSQAERWTTTQLGQIPFPLKITGWIAGVLTYLGFGNRRRP